MKTIYRKLKEHARIQEFSSGGPGSTDRKKNSDNVYLLFPFFPFLVLNLFYSFTESGPIIRKTINFKVPEEVQHFPGKSNFSRGPNANFYRNLYNLGFSRGIPTPYPPLLTLTLDSFVCNPQAIGNLYAKYYNPQKMKEEFALRAQPTDGSVTMYPTFYKKRGYIYVCIRIQKPWYPPV